MKPQIALTRALYDSGRVHTPDFDKLYTYERRYIIAQIASLQYWYYR